MVFPLDQLITTNVAPNFDFIAFFSLEQLHTVSDTSKKARKLHFIAFFPLDQHITTNAAPNPDFIAFLTLEQLPTASGASKEARK